MPNIKNKKEGKTKTREKLKGHTKKNGFQGDSSSNIIEDHFCALISAVKSNKRQVKLY